MTSFVRPLSNTICRKPDISAARHHPTYRECLQATLHRRSCEASMAHGQALERFRGRRRHISTENCKQSMSRIDLGPSRVVTNQAEDFISWGMQKTSNKNTFCCLFNGSFPCRGRHCVSSHRFVASRTSVPLHLSVGTPLQHLHHVAGIIFLRTNPFSVRGRSNFVSQVSGKAPFPCTVKRSHVDASKQALC